MGAELGTPSPNSQAPSVAVAAPRLDPPGVRESARTAPAWGPGDLDELYEGLVERLRRDLLLERERMGNLYGV
ncbi:MAG: hypothetical protein ACLP0J_31135 [Solirubrobacteraceae bacterium]|jgi:hypothetical protein